MSYLEQSELLPVPPPPRIPHQDFQISTDCAVHRSAFYRGQVFLLRNGVLCPHVILRGDEAAISLGECVFVGEGVVIRPPLMPVEHSQGPPTLEFCQVDIGHFTYFGEKSVCEASRIGSFVVLQGQCILGPRCTIGSCVVLQPGTVVPADTVLGSYGIYGGNPIRRVGELHQESADLEISQWVLARIADVRNVCRE